MTNKSNMSNTNLRKGLAVKTFRYEDKYCEITIFHKALIFVLFVLMLI